jgi:HK97 family phage prohead protease
MTAIPPPYGRIHVFPLHIKAAADQAFEGWASTPAVDREGEIIEPEAIAASLEAYMRNPIVTYAHDWLNPVGRTVEARVTEAGLWVKIQLGRTTKAREVWQLIEDRILRSLSIGFNAGADDGDDRDGVWRWRRIELLEIAVVPIPANPQATFTVARGLGLDMTLPMRVKAATPFANLPLAPEETPWRWDARAAAEVLGEPADWDRYRRAHAWWDPERPQTRDAHKLPFARMVEGELTAVWRGVAAAMAALLGARGGVDIPAGDRRAVYDHLARYYDKFGKRAPEFRGAWPESLRAVRFHCEEPDIFAEEQVLWAAAEIERLARDAGNMARHWTKEGRTLTPWVTEPVETACAALGELLAYGRPELAVTG